jgi:peptidoglycan/xylan/chitin deacetylase (PgdA/CDA1 family)
MRAIRALALIMCLTAAFPQPAAADACATGAGKLGVSRTLTVDAAPGPQYGGKYKGGGLLKTGEVVLTFDDGPSRNVTRPILEALAAQCTKATFFMLGKRALADHEMVKEVARAGHTVANHTWSHANLQLVSAEEGEAQIELGLSAIQRALGKPIAPFFRFPYLRDTPATLAHVRGRHLATFSIDVDSRDFEIKDAAALKERVMKDLATRGRGIILLHDIHPSTARALPALLTELKERAYKVVHLRAAAGAESVEDYDTALREAVERRRVAGNGSSLEKRALTWPLTEPAFGAQSKGKATPAEPQPGDDWASKLWSQ